MERQFKFLVPVAKAQTDEEGKLFVEGIASDTGLDLYKERISLTGQESMAAWARTGIVALGGEANHFQIAFDDDLGYITDGRVLDSGEFYIRADLDQNNPRAIGLHKQLSGGKQLGLSVFGRVTESHTEGQTPVIDGVVLERVMVTPMPVNPRTWLEAVAKSMTIEEEIEPEGIGAAADAADMATIAKGAFMDALIAWQQMMEERAPFDEQWKRIQDIALLLDILWDVAYQIWWDNADPEQAAALLRESIDEFKSQVTAKAQSKANETAATIAKTVEPPSKDNKIETIIPDPVPMPMDEAPAVRVARSFADAAAQLLSDETLEPAAQRKGVMAALANVAMALDDTLPELSDDEEAPAWAQAMMERLGALEKALQGAVPANVSAGSQKTPEDEDNLAQVPVRKSQAPDVRPSAVVEKARTFQDLVKQLTTGSGLMLP